MDRSHPPPRGRGNVSLKRTRGARISRRTNKPHARCHLTARRSDVRPMYRRTYLRLMRVKDDRLLVEICLARVPAGIAEFIADCFCDAVTECIPMTHSSHYNHDVGWPSAACFCT